MQIAKTEKYDNKQKIVVKKIKDVPKIKRNFVLMSDKDKIKLIKTVERIVRGSQEYRDYIRYLKDEVDMTMCSFFNNINNKEGKKVSIEIHHEPFTLFDITQIVVDKWITEEMVINPILIAEEIMKVHYQNKIGLIPLSVTIHELVHVGKLFIPLQNVYGRFTNLLEEYGDYINLDIKEMLECKFKMSLDIENMDMSILEKKFVYLEVDGMSFPQPLELPE